MQLPNEILGKILTKIPQGGAKSTTQSLLPLRMLNRRFSALILPIALAKVHYGAPNAAHLSSFFNMLGKIPVGCNVGPYISYVKELSITCYFGTNDHTVSFSQSRGVFQDAERLQVLQLSGIPWQNLSLDFFDSPKLKQLEIDLIDSPPKHTLEDISCVVGRLDVLKLTEYRPNIGYRLDTAQMASSVVPELGRLRVLELDRLNDRTRSLCKAIAKHCTHLETLKVKSLTDKGLELLCAESPKEECFRTSIQNIEVQDYSYLTVAAIPSLQRLTKLKRVKIYYSCGFTAEDFAQFERALPGVVSLNIMQLPNEILEKILTKIPQGGAKSTTQSLLPLQMINRRFSALILPIALTNVDYVALDAAHLKSFFNMLGKIPVGCNVGPYISYVKELSIICPGQCDRVSFSRFRGVFQDAERLQVLQLSGSFPWKKLSLDFFDSPNLVHIKLWPTRALSSSCFESLVDRRKCPKLKKLDIDSRSVTRRGYGEYLKGLSCVVGRLDALKLTGCQLYTAQMASSVVPELGRLRVLELNRLNDRTTGLCKAIAEHCTHLETLKVLSLTGKALELLCAESPKEECFRTSIENIEIFAPYYYLTVNAIPLLQRLTNLKRVKISYRFTAEDFAQFERALPGVVCFERKCLKVWYSY